VVNVTHRLHFTPGERTPGTHLTGGFIVFSPGTNLEQNNLEFYALPVALLVDSSEFHIRYVPQNAPVCPWVRKCKRRLVRSHKTRIGSFLALFMLFVPWLMYSPPLSGPGLEPTCGISIKACHFLGVRPPVIHFTIHEFIC
jgi:hypothetical protein